jgi:ATP-binding cassette subfamily C protein LapB
MTASSDDSLLQSLLALCRYHGSASTAEALVGGLPLENGRLTPALFERAASRVGLVSRILPRSARDVEPALLPAVVLLKNDSACLLMGWSEDGAVATVIFPALNEAAVEMPAEKLLDEECGRVIVSRPRFRFDQRTPRTGTSERGHWFWDAIRANMPIYRDVLLASTKSR